MKLTMSLAAVALIPCLTIAPNKHKENKEQLVQVTRIYVAGEGVNAEKVRDRIGRAKACFVLAEKGDPNDAVLYIAVPGEPGLMALQSTESVQGELKKDGSVIWSTESTVPTHSNRNAAVGL